jgi:hypothetical protein
MKAAVVAPILRRACILMGKIVFHHFFLTEKVREMGCSVPHSSQGKMFKF